MLKPVMNILFLTRFDPRDIKYWSGTLYSIYNKLKEKHHVEIIGTEIIEQLGLFTKGNFLVDTFIHSDRYAKNLGRLLSERINIFNFDLVFFGDLLFIPLDIKIPLILFSDMTYEQVKIYYTSPDERDIEPCINLEKLLFETSFRIIFPSEWIKRKAIEFYRINSKKINVVEFGANIPSPLNYCINTNIDVCRLVFIGRDWERKGGDKVLQIYKILKKEQYPCSLTIIGSTPEEEQDEDEDEDEDLVIIPFLDKKRKEQTEKLCNILFKSHFLVLPTNFDAFGIVFCEASAYALPSITANVGGVGQVGKRRRKWISSSNRCHSQ